MKRLFPLILLAALTAGACSHAGLVQANTARVVPAGTDACSLVAAERAGAALGGAVGAALSTALGRELPGVRSTGCRYSATDGSAAFALIGLVVGTRTGDVAEVFNLDRGPLVTRKRKDISGLGDGAFYDVDRHVLHVLRYNTLLLLGAIPASGDTSQATVLPIDESLARTAMEAL